MTDAISPEGEFSWVLPPVAEPSDELFTLLDWLHDLHRQQLAYEQHLSIGELTPHGVDQLLSHTA